MEAKEGYNSQELKKPLGLCLCGGGTIGFAHIRCTEQSSGSTFKTPLQGCDRS